MDAPESEQKRYKGICIGNAIRHFRLEQGQAMELMAMELALDVNAYALMEANQLAVNENDLNRLAHIFNVSVIELLTLQLNLIEGLDGSATTIQKQEIDRIEGLYQDQLNHLQEEASYLRGLLDSLAPKS
jgi:transcriptional regulator with XRE-family HTH domain